MISQQVLRYSALCLGVIYGFYHQRKISATQRSIAQGREYKHKQELIDKAKAAYAESKKPKSAIAEAAAKTGGCKSTALTRPSFSLDSRLAIYVGTRLTYLPVNQDPMDEKFDLESYLQALFDKEAKA